MLDIDITTERRIRWLVYRLGISADRARLLAGLAYGEARV
ncbi:hypothetical protein J2X36_004611 [Methylobacterium sp. BE186]|nr:hypothetical protein [Methylobacterium sp. BE186]